MENIEKHQSLKRTSQIAIRPFVNPEVENMGLEKYNMVLFEGAVQEEPLAFKEINGVRRYMTGLDEFAPEVQSLPEAEKKAVIKEIRETIVLLEKSFAANVLKSDDANFWDKVKVIRNDNTKFWDKIIIRVSNDPVFLEPTKDHHDLVKLRAIEAGGFSIVAKSLEEARKKGTYKFYLDRHEESAAVRTEVKKLRNKALAELQSLFDKNTNKLFFVCKIVDPMSTNYKKNTPNDIMYDNMDKYINGETVERDKKKTAERFLEIAALDMETLKLRAMIRDAKFYNIIGTRADGHIYHLKTNTMMGKNPSHCIEFLKNVLNEEILKEITVTVEKYWNS